MNMSSKKFWKGKKVIITGHTGFTGSWLCYWLSKFGCTITVDNFGNNLTVFPAIIDGEENGKEITFVEDLTRSNDEIFS